MLLINWHNINRQVIDFASVNFLTGPTGSGKSTAIDGLQVLLLGKTDGSFFNKAATTTVKKQDKRSLKGYLYNSIGMSSEEEGNIYKRQENFTSYLVAEFTETIPGKNDSQFCYGVVFDCQFPSDPEKHFFWLKTGIPEDEFVEKQKPITGYNLATVLKDRLGRGNYEVFTSDRLYQEHLRAALGNLNTRFHELFRKAVPFDPSIDLAQFLSDFACDVDTTIDISGMQDSIAHYSKLRSESDRVKRQVAVLSEICQNHKEYTEYEAKAKLYQYVVDRGNSEYAKFVVETRQNTLNTYTEEFDLLKSNIDNLRLAEIELQTKHIKAQEAYFAEKARLDNIEKSINRDIEYVDQDLQRINQESERLSTMLKEYLQHWTRVDATLITIVNMSEKLFELVKSVDPLISNNLHQCIDDMVTRKNVIKDWLKRLAYPISSNELVYFFQNKDELGIQIQALQEFSEAASSGKILISEAVRRLNIHKDEVEKEIQSLEQGIKPIETRLRDFLVDLKEAMGPLAERANIRLLGDCLEIRNLEWQKAIEGYLGWRKFHILVEPDTYKETLSKYRQLRKEKGYHSFGIIDGAKLLQDDVKPSGGSLAEEITTSDRIAKSYINYVLGRVMKAESLETINQFRTSMTKDCWRYQGYVLEHLDPKTYRDLYIGQKSLQIRLDQARLEKNNTENRLNNLTTLLSNFSLCAQSKTLSDSEVEQARYTISETTRLPELYEKKSNLIHEKTNIDKTKLEELELEVGIIQTDWINAQKVFNEAKTRIQFLETEIISYKDAIPTLLNNFTDALNKLQSYDNEWAAITAEPFYLEYLEKVKDPQLVARNYMPQVTQFSNLREDSMKKVKSLRIQYAKDFPDAVGILDLESPNNDDWAKEHVKLVESALPDYEERIDKSKQRAYEQFQTDFLSRLYQNISSARRQIQLLSTALEDVVFGNGIRFQLRVYTNQNYQKFYQMIMDESLSQGQSIFSASFQEKYADVFKEFFAKFIPPEADIISDQYLRNLSNEAKTLTDYRTYLNFEMEEILPNGQKLSLTKSINVKSGGESQTVFYVSVLASFMKLYRVKEGIDSHTFRLVVFDEAFSKMDDTRIKNSLQWLRETGLQIILAAPPEKAAHIIPYVDKVLVTSKSDEGTIILPMEYKEKRPA